MKPQRVIARFGMSDNIPVLVIGEIGFDVDKKQARFGDDTSDAPKIPSHKTSGEFEYNELFFPKFGKIRLVDGGDVDGVDLSELNKEPGILVRGQDANTWFQRIIESDEYFTIENPGGIDGNIKIVASQKLQNLINKSRGYTYSEEPPVDASPGDVWYSLSDETAYILLADSENQEEYWWLDFTSFSGGGSGNKFFYSDLPPATSSVGDEWFDPAEERLYKRLLSDNVAHWIEISTL